MERLKKPCRLCPYTRTGLTPEHLTEWRIRNLANIEEWTCHMTVVVKEPYHKYPEDHHKLCAGHKLFNGEGHPNVYESEEEWVSCLVHSGR